MLATATAIRDSKHAAAAAEVDATVTRAEKHSPQAPDALSSFGNSEAEAKTREDGKQELPLALHGTLGAADGIVAVEEVVAAAVSSIPARAVSGGVATQQQLSTR